MPPLPVYNALHVPGAPAWITWGGALASCAIGLVILDGLARWIFTRTRELQCEGAALVGSVSPRG